MSNQFDKLPLELIFVILSYVPIPSLLSFGATSKSNHLYHALCMRRLHLAIFPKQLHAIAAFLDASLERSAKEPTPFKQDMMLESHKVRIALPQGMTTSRSSQTIANYSPFPTRYRKKKLYQEAAPTEERLPYSVSSDNTIRAQNKTFAQILSRYGQSLEDLEFLAYNLNDEGAMALGTHCGGKLRHLGLRFEHPYIRDISLSQKYWNLPAPGSPVWNDLIGIGPLQRGQRITNLESLVLERAGITPWQLCMLVKRNKRLSVLKLRTCAAIQPAFVNWLGGIPTPGDEDEELREHDDEPVPGASLVVLWIENCVGIRTTAKSTNDQGVANIDAGLGWLQNLKALQSLSLRECQNIDATVVQEANRLLWHIPEVYLPRPIRPQSEVDPVIEVDTIDD
ncbi:hypothetical protein UA08_05119 [Talaromyces atroroseus]|uniref:F-box domain-containing protein n=1 Tax=Talaromyces atroroseus TaxID=1441469 RepID=A0A225AJC0_TALAT|nr:hypothetical protein UA08_05119 [Talaromyces atroroseus]OKL59453.1 hypothetical protein UA08_05119 [Talaromyces atroroseus]